MFKEADSPSLLKSNFPDLLNDRSLKDFLKELAESDTKSIGVCSFPIKAIDPLACIEVLGKKDSYQFYWEKPHSEFSIAAGSALETISGDGEKRFDRLQEAIQRLKKKIQEFKQIEHSYSGIHILGGASFFDETPSASWKGFSSASFVLPEWMVIKDGELGILTIAIGSAKNDTAADLEDKLAKTLEDVSPIFKLEEKDVLETPDFSEKTNPQVPANSILQWQESVNTAKKLIQDNTFDKIVLARKISLELNDDIIPTFVLNRLRRQYPNCYSFLIKFPNSGTFIGCSPERLVSFHKKYLRTDALAGSIKRGASATEDVVFEDQLLNSTKDNNEHQFVTRAIVERLEEVSDNIEKGEKPTIKKLSNVQHLYTPIRAWIDEKTDRLDILKTLHPTPAVGGYPWHKARDYIKDLESFDRGWYAGPVGWLNMNGNGEFAVSIRSGLIKENKANFFAGCGIVKNSDPQQEWEETNLKFSPMLSALRDV